MELIKTQARTWLAFGVVCILGACLSVWPILPQREPALLLNFLAAAVFLALGIGLMIYASELRSLVYLKEQNVGQTVVYGHSLDFMEMLIESTRRNAKQFELFTLGYNPLEIIDSLDNSSMKYVKIRVSENVEKIQPWLMLIARTEYKESKEFKNGMELRDFLESARAYTLQLRQDMAMSYK